MKKRLITLIQYLFFLGIGVFLVWFSARNVDEQGWKLIRMALKDAHFWLFVPVFFILGLSHLLRAQRWRLLMEPLGYKPSLLLSFAAVMVGYLANLAIPRLGEVLKCTILARYEKVPADKLIGTIVVERAVDVISLLFIFALAIFFQAPVVGEYGKTLWLTLIAKNPPATLAWKLVLLAILLITLYWVLKWILKRLIHLPLIQKIAALLKGISQGLSSVRHLKKRGWFIAHSFFIWALYLTGTRIGFLALNDTLQYGWAESLSVLGFGSVGMIVTQGGIGAYQIAVQQIMLLYGLAAPIGLALGWLQWIAQTLVILILGVIAAATLPLFKRQSNAEHTIHPR